ncbi:hypothetical protein D781_0599 [Serratia sp. FGI94]|nr:hypothetical protein D781_0599 [Serratia sp. FGI94]
MYTRYPSYFELQMRWLRSVTRITDRSQLIGIPSLAAFLQLELFRVTPRHTSSCRCESLELLTGVRSLGFLSVAFPPLEFTRHTASGRCVGRAGLLA